jgi:hypothetical protein
MLDADKTLAPSAAGMIRYIEKKIHSPHRGLEPAAFRLVAHCLNHYATASEKSEFLATDPEVRVRFPAQPDFLRSSGSGTGSTQPREYN